MSRPREKFMDDLKIVISVDLVGREDAVFAVDREESDRDHQVAGELEGVGLGERKVVRHLRGSIWSGPIPARWLLKRPGDGRDHREAKRERPQLASGPFTG